MLLLTNIFLQLVARVGFFRVKQSARLLLCNNSAVTNGSEVDWIDIHMFLHFIDRLEVLVGRFNGGRPRGICVPLLHIERVQLCRETYGTSCFLLYMLFINYCLYTVLQL